MLIAPSVTPWRARIGGGRVAEARNPGVRKIHYHTTNFRLTEVEQFYLNLDEANQQEDANWRRLYSFRSLYGVENVSAQELHDLAEDFKEYASEKFHDYYKMNSVAAREPSNVPCSCRCKFEHICAIQNVEYEDFDECMETFTCSGSRCHLGLLVVILAVLVNQIL